MKKTNNYVVIKLNGKQLKVAEGDVVEVDKISSEKLKPEVLLAVEGEKIVVGRPIVDKVSVKLKLVEDVKGKKLYVSKYKAKSRYRKTIGFRPQYTKILVEKISF